MNRIADKINRRSRRRFRIRKRMAGSVTRPRITVYRSNRYTYLQAVDDGSGHTLTAASNRETTLREITNNREGMAKLGEEFGKRLQQKKVDTAVFDRNGYLYHGCVKALADGIRKAGIRF